MSKLINIRQAADELGVSLSTMRRWDNNGKLKAARTPAGQRRYDKESLKKFQNYSPGQNEPPTIPQQEVEAINTALRTLPPAGGNYAIDNIQQYIGIVQTISRFYRNPDEAILNNPMNAKIMFNNLVIREPLQARMLATAELPWHIEPEDKRDPYQLEVAQGIQRIIEDTPDFLKMRFDLLYAVWFGRYAAQIKYGWDFKDRKRLIVKEWSPVSGDSLVYKWDSNDVGVYVGIYNGYPGTKELDTEPGWISRVHVLTDQDTVYHDDDGKPYRKLGTSERDAFVIHTHDLVAGEFTDPQSAGSVKGLGLRSVVYWTWYTLQNMAGWMADFMERVGTGITLYKFIRGDQESYNAAKELAESQSVNAAVMMPVDPMMNNGLPLEGIERIEPSAVGLDNLLKVLDDYYGGQIRRYIVGQDATSRSQGHGLSNQDLTAENTFNRLVRYDAINLQETLTHQMVRVIQRWTYPEAEFKCRFVIDVDRPNSKDILDGVKSAYEIGVSFDEDEVRALTGLSKPDLDAVILRLENNKGVNEAEGAAEVTASGKLAETVGGLQAIAGLQQDYYAGKIPQSACVNNVILLFGFKPEEAAALFPEIPPEKLTQDEFGSPPLEESNEESPFTFQMEEGDDDVDAEVKLTAILNVLSIEDLSQEEREAAVDEIAGSTLFKARFAGFTGNRKDKIGRNTCWRDGKRIPCPKKDVPKKERGPRAIDKTNRPQTSQIHDEITAKLKGGKITDQDVHDLGIKLTQLTVKDIHDIKKKLGLKASGRKVELANKVAERALRSIKGDKGKVPEVKTPEVKAPEVKAPEVKTPEVKKPEVKKPKKTVNTPKEPEPSFTKGQNLSTAEIDKRLKSIPPEYGEITNTSNVTLEMLKIMNEVSEEGGKVKVHGMRQEENSHSMTVNGINIQWTNIESQQAAARSIPVMFKNVPTALTDNVKQVVFTYHANQNDEHWGKEYNIKDFKSHATGGNGIITVYRDSSMGQNVFCHEAGHNLAQKTWGSSTPDQLSEYGLAQLSEPPVTPYGGSSPSEDFAEACMLYCSKTQRANFKQQFPKKYEALKKLLGELKE